MLFIRFLPMILLIAISGLAAAQDGKVTTKEADSVLSPTFRACFGKDAPLNAESYGCLDREYRRLDALLSKEYRAALARQPDEAAMRRLQRDERNWWRTRFRHCKDEVGDFRGSTATVINENCENDALAQRIVWLQHYGRNPPKQVKLEGMDYDKARAVILGYGWKPFPGECAGPPIDKSICGFYPELGYCQGTGRGYCGMTFAKENRCLILTTVESPPGRGGYTVITDVFFRPGPCSKDPT